MTTWARINSSWPRSGLRSIARPQRGPAAPTSGAASATKGLKLSGRIRSLPVDDRQEGRDDSGIELRAAAAFELRERGRRGDRVAEDPRAASWCRRHRRPPRSRADRHTSSPRRPLGYPSPSMRSCTSRTTAAASARYGTCSMSSLPMRGCRRMRRCSSSVSGAGLRSTASGIASFPRSCSSAARSSVVRSAAQRPSVRPHGGRKSRDAIRMRVRVGSGRHQRRQQHIEIVVGVDELRRDDFLEMRAPRQHLVLEHARATAVNHRPTDAIRRHARPPRTADRARTAWSDSRRRPGAGSRPPTPTSLRPVAMMTAVSGCSRRS